MSEALTAVESQPETSKMTHERVIELIEKWRKLLLLGGHHIDVNFGTEPCADERCCAEMLSNTPYLSGHYLTIHPRFFEVGDDDERERKIVHELCHLITSETSALMRAVLVHEKLVTTRETKDANERLTDFIANICYALARERECQPPAT